MLTLQGKYNTCKVFTDHIDEATEAQLINLLNQPSFEHNKIRIMPDCHAGAGCVIGTTMDIHGKAVPDLVGVDIGCTITCIKLKNKDVDLQKLDDVIHANVPAGFGIRSTPHPLAEHIAFEKLYAPIKDMDWVINSVGTLGGGEQ